MPEENEENIKLLNRRVTRNCEQTGRGRIRINVSGLEFKTYASTLERFPGRISTSFLHLKLFMIIIARFPVDFLVIITNLL